MRLRLLALASWLTASAAIAAADPPGVVAEKKSLTLEGAKQVAAAAGAAALR